MKIPLLAVPPWVAWFLSIVFVLVVLFLYWRSREKQKQKLYDETFKKPLHLKSLEQTLFYVEDVLPDKILVTGCYIGETAIGYDTRSKQYTWDPARTVFWVSPPKWVTILKKVFPMDDPCWVLPVGFEVRKGDLLQLKDGAFVICDQTKEFVHVNNIR